MASSGQDPNTAAMELLLDDSQTGQNSEKIIRLGMQGLWRQPTDTAAQFGRFLEYILTTNCSADCYYRHQYSWESRACQSLRLCKTAVFDMTTTTCMMADVGLKLTFGDSVDGRCCPSGYTTILRLSRGIFRCL